MPVPATEPLILRTTVTLSLWFHFTDEEAGSASGARIRERHRRPRGPALGWEPGRLQAAPSWRLAGEKACNCPRVRWVDASGPAVCGRCSVNITSLTLFLKHQVSLAARRAIFSSWLPL